MAIVVSVDIGTTTITSLAWETTKRSILAKQSELNQSETTSAADKALGRSEWDAAQMVNQAVRCIRRVVDQLGPLAGSCVGIGITGQQHGVVVVDDELRPLTPFVGWQDRRADDRSPQAGCSYVEEARRLLGHETPARTGCRLATGYLAATLYWMRLNGLLPPTGTACFISDLLGATLTGQRPITDPTNAASGGVLNVAARQWDDAALDRLELPRGLFPEVREAGQQLGGLTTLGSARVGLPQGTPVCVALGDHQAAFLGSVPSRHDTALVNIGTGGQVAGFTERFSYAPPLETRPYPGAGNLLVNAGLCGGRSYAVLERFFAGVLESFGRPTNEPLPAEPLYEAMNRLAAQAPRGADGLVCVPLFTGTRAQPELRASWTGVSPSNFTAPHLVRALLEGMARVFREGKELIAAQTGRQPRQLAGSGNALRDNPVLAQIIAEEFGLPLTLPPHREEAALGAALVAGIGTGVYAELPAAAAGDASS